MVVLRADGSSSVPQCSHMVGLWFVSHRKQPESGAALILIMLGYQRATCVASLISQHALTCQLHVEAPQLRFLSE